MILLQWVVTVLLPRKPRASGDDPVEVDGTITAAP